MNKKVFTVELDTDSPNSIDAAEVHLALMKYFVAFVSIDVKNAAQQSVQRIGETVPLPNKEPDIQELIDDQVSDFLANR